MLGSFRPYLRFVCGTSTWAHAPADHLGTVKRNQPVIIALWHGQTMLLPEVLLFEIRPSCAIVANTLVAEPLARTLQRMGIGVIRGAGRSWSGKRSTRCKGASSGYQVSRWRGERRNDGRPVDMLSQVWSRHCDAGAPLWPTNCGYGYCLVPLLLAAHAKSIYDQFPLLPPRISRWQVDVHIARRRD